MHTRRSVITTGAALAAGAVGLAGTTTAAATQTQPPSGESATDPRPLTVPALQSWTPGGLDFTLPETVLVFVDRRFAAELADDAETFAQDLRALTGRRVVVKTVGPIRVDNADPRDTSGPGAEDAVIRLTLDPSWDRHGPEASTIAVAGAVTVWGPTGTGVFWGTRSLLQMLRQGDVLAGGTAVDWPGYAERSLMIDNGRKYFTVEWAKRQIRELAYLKYNQFRWHLTDNQGFRIESTRFPDLMSARYWTQDEVRELVEYAGRHHVEVVPEIDMPGHMLYALRDHPALQLVDRDGIRAARNLDPTSAQARAFVTALLDELIPLFPGRYVHTGGDEFTLGRGYDDFPALENWADAKFGGEANGKDAVLDFTNFVNDVVRSHGKTMRMWNDGAQGGSLVEANRNIVLEYWSSYGPLKAQGLLDRGFELVNANNDVLYDVPGRNGAGKNLDPRVIYDTWDMTIWIPAGGSPNTTPPRAPGVLGGQLHVWNDRPAAATEEEIALRIQTSLRAHAQVLWDSPRLAETWDGFYPAVFAAGREPRWQLLDGDHADLARGRMVWSSSRERIHLREEFLTDGNASTRWASRPTDPQSVVIDLEQHRELGTIVMDWETAYASAYDVEVSDDLVSWRTIHSTTTGDGGVDVLPVEAEGRYLRLDLNGRGTRFGSSLWGVEVYGPGVVAPAHVDIRLDPGVLVLRSGEARTSRLVAANDGDEPVRIGWSAPVPDRAGVTVQPAEGEFVIPAGGRASVELTVSGEHSGVAPVLIEMTQSSGGADVARKPEQLLASVPYGSLAEAYGNVGVTHDADPSPPGLVLGFDGSGSSYSAEALAASGVRPGGPLVANGVEFTWPDADASEANNVVAHGQTVELDGVGARIAVLAATTYGPATGTWWVHYADGSMDSATMTHPGWRSTPPAGSTVAVSVPYHNAAGVGRVDRTAYVFMHSIPIDPDKAITAVTLPMTSAEVIKGQPAVHVFDLVLD